MKLIFHLLPDLLLPSSFIYFPSPQTLSWKWEQSLTLLSSHSSQQPSLTSHILSSLAVPAPVPISASEMALGFSLASSRIHHGTGIYFDSELIVSIPYLKTTSGSLLLSEQSPDSLEQSRRLSVIWSTIFPD